MTLTVNRFELRPPANAWAKQWGARNRNRFTIPIILCALLVLQRLDINVKNLGYEDI